MVPLQGFFFNCGVRQGCPVSPYLFLIAVQFLNLYIKRSNIKGVTIGNVEFIISQLMTQHYFLKDSSQVSVALNILQVFTKASGLNLNIDKYELLPIKNCCVSSICGVAVKNIVTYRGINIMKNENRCATNLNPVIAKTKKKFNGWLQRDFLLKEEFCSLKLRGYRISLMHLSYMKMTVILNSYNKGGLHFIDFNSLNYAFKINWLNKYLKNQHSIWYIFPQQAFSFVGGITFLLMCNNNISKITVKLSNFHQQVLLAWALIYKHNFTPVHFLFGII